MGIKDNATGTIYTECPVCDGFLDLSVPRVQDDATGVVFCGAMSGVRVTLAKDTPGDTTWGGNGFGTTTDSARWRVLFDGVPQPITLRARTRDFMGPAPAWELTYLTADGTYRLGRSFYPGRTGGASRLAKAWVRANPGRMVRDLMDLSGLGRCAR